MGAQELIGKKFPKITAYSLAKTEIILPDMTIGKVTLIGIAFVRSAQEMLDSWSIPFEDKFSNKSNYTYYEIPMLDGIWKLFRSSIDGGMRAGTPYEKHTNVLTHYGNYKDYTSYLFINNTNYGYVFLLDKEGLIRFRGIGFASEKDLVEMIRIAERLGE
ncbi:MAG: ATP10 protein [Candidatus Methanofastidiosum methylothiophilum]|uniref:ATP10 protein n=1 Tax=Candidatus Methanofastidiosum methylothiophilum TaxID=1705564 RepID=A0A150J0T7_9EURY|nr:MAG: ATP10 protein [Candidatus Methanofastidiosum methylthiophilus]KYC48197.1 MAG: ATP10 protein [Candidatus Methanofastidiosum methylthiophilus]KYC50852.1 MAG: ATP10 protein [Candidatus Methanofastidiosum methylthiophilus]